MVNSITDMKAAGSSIVLFCSFCQGQAETVYVTVGETGCVGRQVAVRQCWEKMSGVSSVTLSPRKPGELPARRTFVVVTTAATAPSVETLRAALGRRAKNYPILAYRKESEQRPAAQR